MKRIQRPSGEREHEGGHERAVERRRARQAGAKAASDEAAPDAASGRLLDASKAFWGTIQSDEEQLRRVARAIKKLSRIQREVLLMSAGTKLTYEEIGVRLGLPCLEVERHLAEALYEVVARVQRYKQPWWRFW